MKTCPRCGGKLEKIRRLDGRVGKQVRVFNCLKCHKDYRRTKS